MNDTARFLEAMWPGDIPGHLVVLKINPAIDKVHPHWCSSIAEAAGVADKRQDGWNTYIGASVQDKAAAIRAKGKDSRGTSQTATALAGVHIDIDTAGGSHKATNLCPDIDAARKLVANTGLLPSVEVSTGNGLQAWWWFDEPILITSDESRRYAASLLASFVATFQQYGAALDYKIDSVGDLARVMRMPGTVNWNGGPKPVEILAMNEVRYAPGDIEDWLRVRVNADPGATRPPAPDDCPADVLEIVDMSLPLLSDNRANDYESWIRVGQALKAVSTGDALRQRWHEFSKRGAGYDAKQADEKWDSFAPQKLSMGSLLFWAREDSGKEVIGEMDWNAPIDGCTTIVETKPEASERQKASKPATTTRSVAASPTGRMRVSNVIDQTTTDNDGKEKDATYYRPIPNIAQTLNEATGGWPRRASGVLFAVNGEGDISNPELRPIQFFSKPDQLFAWLMKNCDVRWHTGTCKHAGSGEKCIAPTKTEFFEYCKQNCEPAYSAVEMLPHHPLVRDVYYIPTNIPAASNDLDSSPLWELVNHLNPETDLDRMLILAAMLTPGWGGPCGARPAFVFTSDHGRGVGKTLTAGALSDIWGGNITVSGNEDWDTVRKRLLGDESMTKRVIIIDNLKGRLNSGDIEGAITMKSLDGWKPYHGQASRPNRMTWYITANAPSLSRDLADRAIIIKIGKQKHGVDFSRWATEHIEKHRGEILAELFAILQRDPVCKIDRKNRDRWQAWQDAILSRLDDGDELAELAIARRPDVDADLSDADEIADVFYKLFEERQIYDHEAQRILIHSAAAHEALIKHGIIEKSFSRRSCYSWIVNMAGQGSLADFRPHKGMHSRGFLFTGKQYTDSKMIELAELGFTK